MLLLMFLLYIVCMGLKTWVQYIIMKFFVRYNLDLLKAIQVSTKHIIDYWKLLSLLNVINNIEFTIITYFINFTIFVANKIF